MIGDVAPFQTLAGLGGAVSTTAETHLERVFRSLLRHPTKVENDGFMRYITGEPHPFGNLAVISDRTDPGITQEAIAPLRECGAPAAALYFGQEVAHDVAARLEEAGFESHGHMPAMAVEIDRLAPAALTEDYRFERTGEESASEWAERFAAGYEIPLGVATVFSPLAIPPDPAPDAPVQFFAVTKDGRIVATSLMCLKDGVAGIYCVATVPEERGKGLGAFATAEPLRIARTLGYGVGVLQSSEMGHSVYKRLGFADVGGLPLYVRMPE